MSPDISPITDIRKTTARNTSERRGSSRCGAAVLLTSSPYKNKFTEDLEKNAAKYKKKAGNDRMKGGVKQNHTRKGKQKATKDPIEKKKRESTLTRVTRIAMMTLGVPIARKSSPQTNAEKN
jgi:hypothetical protein